MPDSNAIKPPRVFISYSHDSEPHKAQVLKLANRLRSHGIDANLDRYEPFPPQGWQRWMRDEIEKADFVLLICTETYRERFYGHETEGGRGVTWEGALISDDLYQAHCHNTKFIPCVFAKDDEAYVPDVLNGAPHYLVNTDPGYWDLYRLLTNQPAVVRPPLGDRVTLRPEATADATPAQAVLPALEPKPVMQNFLAAAPLPLQADIDDFQGRDSELDCLLGALGKGGGHAAICAVGGMGGIGKTVLAVRAAHRLKDHYPDGQYQINLQGVSEAEALTSAQALERLIRIHHPSAQLPEDETQLAAIYRQVFAGKRALMLLDNALNVRQVNPLLLDAPAACLVTSRQRLVLDGKPPIDLDALEPAEALALLRGLVPEDRATDAELDSIAGLCGRVPLALRAAGTYLLVYSDRPAAGYIAALDDERTRLKRLGLKDHGLDVEATLALSVRRLHQEKAKWAHCWQMLSVFPAPFDTAAAASVCGIESDAAQDLLSELFRRSLLLHDPETHRYRLHDLMRPIARAAHTYTGEAEDTAQARLDTAQERHARHYLGVLAKADDLFLKGHDGVLEGLALAGREWPHILAGQTWAAAHAETLPSAAQCCNAYPNAGTYVLDLRLHPRQKIAWIESALTVARTLGNRRAEGSHLGNLGNAYVDLGEMRRAIGYHEQALEIAREVGDRHGEGAILSNVGVACKNLGEVRRAIEYHEQALEISREIGDRRGEGNALGNLGNAYKNLDEVRRAIECYEQCLKIHREIGDRRGEGIDLGNLGLAYADLGEMRRAIEYYEQQLVIVREIGDRRGEGISCFNMAVALDGEGRREEAIALMQQAERIFTAIEDPNAEKASRKLQEWGVA